MKQDYSRGIVDCNEKLMAEIRRDTIPEPEQLEDGKETPKVKRGKNGKK